MTELMALVVGWALVGAFVFTLLVTCLSLVGWIQFKYPEQQRRLFSALIIEIVLAVGGSALGRVRFGVKAVEDALKSRGANEEIVATLRSGIRDAEAGGTGLTRDQAERLIGRIDVGSDRTLAREKAALHLKVSALPSGWISPKAARNLAHESPLIQEGGPPAPRP